MTRILTLPGSLDTPSIDPNGVAAFFDARARRLNEVGPLHAVIYQDKQGDLALRRDQAECNALLPELRLDGRQRLLDIGCGTGRWTSRVAPLVAHYHGIDFSEGLLAHARSIHGSRPNCRFTRLGADELSPSALGERDFDRILCAGIAIYLNDPQLVSMLNAMAMITSPGALILVREPMGINNRLTLHEHYSDELEQEYHAIYRTESEFETVTNNTLGRAGYRITRRGDVYTDPILNNRSETRQRWLVLERPT